MTTRTFPGLKLAMAVAAIKPISRLFLGGLLLSLAAILMTGCSDAPKKLNAMDVTGAEWGKTYSLPDLDGKTVTPADFQGKITALFFGFMYCPDACPTHLAKMGELRKALGKDADKLQLVFITVDPERDSPEKLKQYLQSFDPTAVGLRGTVAQTEALAKDFRVFYKKVPTKDSAKDPMAYTIDHTTFTYIFDTKGQLRLVVPHDLAVEKIAADVQYLLRR